MTFLLNTRTDWYETPRARHQIARALAKLDNVVFVSKNKFGSPNIEFSSPEKNITVITPRWYINGGYRARIPFINEIYQFWLFNKIKNLYPSCITINFDFSATQIFNFFSNVIYYCNDDPLSQINLFHKLPIPYFYITEKIILKKSLFTVVVSDYLFNAKKTSNKHLIPLGVDNLFEGKGIFSINKSIRLNFMGYIDNRIEIKWINRIATDFPDWQIDLVGPISRKYRNSFISNNITIFGPKYSNDLINIIRKCSVGIIPFKNNKRMRTVSANNKFWQYLSMGKPIVYRDLPFLIKLPEHFLYKAGSYDEFVNKIVTAIKDDNQGFFMERVEFAKNNSWDIRINVLLKTYRSYTKI